jgi:hypothetical protein
MNKKLLILILVIAILILQISSQNLFLNNQDAYENSIAKGVYDVILELFVKNKVQIDFSSEKIDMRDDLSQSVGYKIHTDSDHFLHKIAEQNEDQFAYRIVNITFRSDKGSDQEGLVSFVENNLFLQEIIEWLQLFRNYEKTLLISQFDLEKLEDQWNKINFKLVLEFNYFFSTDSKYFSAYETLYHFVYWKNKAYLGTMERFSEVSCTDIKFKILNEFDIETGKWKKKLEIPEKYTNFNKCPLFVARSDKAGMKLLTALIDGIAHNYNATFGFIDSNETFAVHVPLYNRINNETEFMPILITPNKKIDLMKRQLM